MVKYPNDHVAVRLVTTSVLTTFQLWKGNMTPFAIAGSKKESIIVRIHLICQLFHDHITTRAPITFQLCKWDIYGGNNYSDCLIRAM